MRAGREMDAAIAEKIMGLTIIHRSWPCGRDPECGEYDAALADDEEQASWYTERGPIYKRIDPAGLEIEDGELGLWCSPVPFYSTDISAAWLVVDKIKLFRTALMAQGEITGRDDEWVIFKERFGVEWEWHVVGDSPAHAICLAALKPGGAP